MIEPNFNCRQALVFFFSALLLVASTAAVGNTFPQILTETHNQTFNLSTRASLTCHVIDLGGHHVTWFRTDPLTSLSSPLAVGERLFTTDERYSVNSYSTSARDSFWSLEIYQVTLADQGTYTCRIANRRASVSMSIHLHVQLPMILTPNDVHLEPGSPIQLNCTILLSNDGRNRSNLLASITWHYSSNQFNRTKFHDIQIRKSSMDNILTSFLTIQQAQSYHTGLWTCIFQGQRLSAKMIVQKDLLRHQRASALLFNDTCRHSPSTVLLFFLLFLVYRP